LLGGDFKQRRGPDRAGVVDHDIERAEMLGNPVGDATDIVVVADIEQARVNFGPVSRARREMSSSASWRAPSRAKACATLRPMPRLAPVMSALFPSSSLIAFQLITVRTVTVLQKRKLQHHKRTATAAL